MLTASTVSKLIYECTKQDSCVWKWSGRGCVGKRYNFELRQIYCSIFEWLNHLENRGEAHLPDLSRCNHAWPYWDDKMLTVSYWCHLANHYSRTGLSSYCSSVQWYLKARINGIQCARDWSLVRIDWVKRNESDKLSIEWISAVVPFRIESGAIWANEFSSEAGSAGTILTSKRNQESSTQSCFIIASVIPLATWVRRNGIKPPSASAILSVNNDYNRFPALQTSSPSKRTWAL